MPAITKKHLEANKRDYAEIAEIIRSSKKTKPTLTKKKSHAK